MAKVQRDMGGFGAESTGTEVAGRFRGVIWGRTCECYYFFCLRPCFSCATGDVYCASFFGCHVGGLGQVPTDVGG